MSDFIKNFAIAFIIMLCTLFWIAAIIALAIIAITCLISGSLLLSVICGVAVMMVLAGGVAFVTAMDMEEVE